MEPPTEASIRELEGEVKTGHLEEQASIWLYQAALKALRNGDAPEAQALATMMVGVELREARLHAADQYAAED